jgi:hypothetical protein
MDGENILIPDTKPFQITPDIYGQAYKTYQNMFVYPKNRIMQLLLLILAVDFGYHGGKDPSNKMAFILMFVCLALIAVLWFNPRKMRRSVMDVVREIEGDEYIFNLYEDRMSFRTLPPDTQETDDVPAEPSVLYLNSEMKASEKAEFFLICKGKQLFYVLPKYALNDNQADILRDTLKNNLGKRFRCNI